MAVFKPPPSFSKYYHIFSYFPQNSEKNISSLKIQRRKSLFWKTTKIFYFITALTESRIMYGGMNLKMNVFQKVIWNKARGMLSN